MDAVGGKRNRAATLWSAAGLAAIGAVIVLLMDRQAVLSILPSFVFGLILAIAVVRLLAVAPDRIRGPAIAVALSLAGLTLILSGVAGRYAFHPFFQLVSSAIGAAFGTRIALDYRRRIPGMTPEELLRRARRGVLLAIPFAIAAVLAGRDVAGESSEDMFRRVILLVPACVLFAAWFVSGAIAPGYAWLLSRTSDGRGGS